MSRITFSFLGLVFLSLFLVIQAQAQTGIQIEPAFQEIVLDPDTVSATISAQIRNHTQQTLEMEVFSLDFVQSPDLGGIELIQRSQSQFQLSPFVELMTRSLSIPPGESASISAIINNSAELSPGGHYGALVARMRPNETPQMQQVLPGISSLVLLKKIGGERYHLSLQQVRWGYNNLFSLTLPQTIYLSFQNSGNIHIVPRGVVLVEDMWGREVMRGAINTSSAFVLPENRRTLPIQLRTQEMIWPVSYLRMYVSGTGEGTDISYIHQQDLIYVDWRLLAIVSILFILILGWWWRRR